MWYYESAIYIQKLRLVTMEAKGMKPEVTPSYNAGQGHEARNYAATLPEVGWHA